MFLLNYLSFVVILFCINACSTRPAKTENTLLEVGGIKDPKKFGANFTLDEATLGAFKVCWFKILSRCHSSSVITKDSRILTNAHGLGYIVDHKSAFFEKPTNIPNLTKDVTLVSAFDKDPSGRPVEPERFKLDAIIVNPHKENSGRDYMIFAPKDIKRFEKWSHPFAVRQKWIPGEAFRMFSIGFPWPYLNLEDLKETEYSPEPTNFDLHIATGLGTLLQTAQMFSQNNPDTKIYESFGAYDGSSGSAVLDKEGYYLGMVVGGFLGGNLYQIGKERSPTSPTTRVAASGIHRLRLDDNIHNLSFVEKIDSEYINKRNGTLSQVKVKLREKADALEVYLRSVYDLFKKNLKTKISVVPKHSGHGHSICFVVGTGKENESMTDYSIVFVEKIEIELLGPLKARMRYYARNRDERKFHEFWKIGKSGWSPWFEFHSSRLLAETRIESIANVKMDGVELRAFAPFLIDNKNVEKHWSGYLDSRIRQEYTFTGQLIEAVIGGLYPSETKDGRSIDNWTPAYCRN